MRTFSCVLFAFLFFSVFTAHGQDTPIDKGSYLIGGTASYTSSDQGDLDDRIHTLSIRPTVQAFVLPGLAVGGDAIVDWTSVGESSTRTVGGGPILSYYFGVGERTVYPFLEISAQAIQVGLDSGSGGSTSANTLLRGELSGGISLMVARNVALTGEAFYGANRYSEDNGVDSNQFGLRFGVTAFIF